MSINRDLADSAAVPPFRKNLIINGDSKVWQRGTTFTAHSGYFADRFTWVKSGAGVVTVKRSATLPPNRKNGYSMRMEVTTADASLVAGDVYGINYPIEAQDIQHLNLGKTEAKTVTLSFWVASEKTGTHCVAFRNEADDRSYVVEYTIDVSATWEYKTVTLTVDTAGTWATDNAVGMSVFFAVASGTTYHGTADIWQTGNYIATSNQVNLMDTIANRLWLTDVQLEVGTEATDFDYRPFAEELAACQRYFHKSYPTDVNPGTSNIVGAWTFNPAAVTVQITIPYPVEMRDAPSLTFYSATGTSGKWTGTTTGEFTPTILLGRSSGGRMTIQNTSVSIGEIIDGHWTADAEF